MHDVDVVGGVGVDVVDVVDVIVEVGVDVADALLWQLYEW